MFPNIKKWISISFFTPMLLAGDLSRYRDFQLGMNLGAAEKQAETKTSDIRTIHQRPVLFQDLEWRPRAFPATDPVKDVLLSFYDGQLFRIVANYDRYRTEGMTADDMIDAISATYGSAAKPAAEILFPGLNSENVKVIARWEDPDYSLNLVQSPYQPGFALISFSKKLNALADASAAEAIRLDLQEAPRREAERVRKQADEVIAKQEKARMANKPGFRP